MSAWASAGIYLKCYFFQLQVLFQVWQCLNSPQTRKPGDGVVHPGRCWLAARLCEEKQEPLRLTLLFSADNGIGRRGQEGAILIRPSSWQPCSRQLHGAQLKWSIRAVEEGQKEGYGWPCLAAIAGCL